jgi:hypothetical protein
MGVFNYQVKADELDESFIVALKSLFKGREIAISVKTAHVKSEPPLRRSASEIVAENRAADFAFEMSGEEFSAILDKFSKDKTYDLEGAFENFKTTNRHAETTN